ncbi:hypothetical protein MMC11_008073 [Xylographa trunciseda]|nr:hypothetical protein [Xylographa trunciseda]
MNSIRQIQQLNKRELENGVAPSASWHADYRDTAYIYIGGLPFTLTEGDVIAIFSQYGEPVAVHLIRDKDTGKSKGFAFLRYEDQRSTELAVDNLGGATVLGRVLRVDHARYKGGEGEGGGEEETGGGKDTGGGGGGEEGDGERELLPEERELERLLVEHDDEDPMKEYLVEEKREEVRLARERASRGEGRGGMEGVGKSERKHKHRHREGGHHGGRRERKDSDGAERRRGEDVDREQRLDGESYRTRRGHGNGDRRSPRRREEMERNSDEDYRQRRRH